MLFVDSTDVITAKALGKHVGERVATLRLVLHQPQDADLTFNKPSVDCSCAQSTS